MSATDFSWDVFISYNGADQLFAEKMYAALVDYRPPVELHLPPKEPGTRHEKLRPFRWTDDMTGVEYETAIKEHLRKSKKLLVICSPDAKSSKYVDEEIKWFAKLRGKKNIVPVLVRGIPNNVEGPEDQKAFPGELCKLFKMPIAVKYIDFQAESEKIEKGDHESAWYHLIANILETYRDEVAQRELKQRATKRRRWAITWFVFAAALLGLFINAMLQRNEARKQLARTHWANGVYFRDNDQPVVAAHWFAKAVDSPDPKLQKAARLAAIQAVRGSELQNIFPLSDPFRSSDPESRVDREVFGAVLNKGGTGVLGWDIEDRISYFDIPAGQGTADDTLSDRDRKPLSISHEYLKGAMFSPDETQIVSWNDRFKSRFWCLTGNECVAGDEIVKRAPVASSPDSGVRASQMRSHLVFKLRQGRMWLWDPIAESAVSQLLPVYPGGVKQCTDNDQQCKKLQLKGAAFGEDRSQIIVWGEFTLLADLSEENTEKKVSAIWMGNESNLQQIKSKYGPPFTGAAVNKSYSRVASWSTDADNRVSILDQELEWESIAQFSHSEPVKGALFTDDGKHLLSWSQAGEIRLWDIETKEGLIPPLHHEGVIRGAAFYSQEERVLSWGDDGYIRSWKIDTTQSEHEFSPVITEPPNTFSPLANSSCNSGHDWVVSFKDKIITLSACGADDKPTITINNMGTVTGASLDRKGERVLSWASDGRVRLWKISSAGSPLMELTDSSQGSSPARVLGAVFNRDESRILSWTENGYVRLWDVALGVEAIHPLKLKGDLYASSARFDEAENCVLFSDSAKEQHFWNLRHDKRANAEQVSRQIQAITGTGFNEANELVVIENVQEWNNLKEELENSMNNIPPCGFTGIDQNAGKVQ